MCVVISLAYALEAFPQSSVDVRSSLGPPIKQSEIPRAEVFSVRPGVELTATYSYSPGHELCKLEMPQGMASRAEMDQILQRVIPSTARGEKWREMSVILGAGYRWTYYTHLIISEINFNSPKPGFVVTFKQKSCGWKPGQDILDQPEYTPTPAQK
jgi:hypothetical protein